VDETDDACYAQLLHSARAGDASSLGKLLGMYQSYLTLLARLNVGRRLQGRVAPSDLVQEAFVEASRHFHHFRGTSEGELVAWLRQIMASRIADAVRRHVQANTRDVRLETRLADELNQSSCDIGQALVAPQSSPSHQAARRERAVILAEALEKLPEDYREVLVLRNLHELSFPDVARRMDRSLDSVKNLWTRALAQLRRELKP